MASGNGKTANLNVRVQPRSSRNEIAGERSERVLIRVTAPPIDGKANTAVCRTVAKALQIPKRCVTVVRGESSRDKVLRIEGINEDQVRKNLDL